MITTRVALLLVALGLTGASLPGCYLEVEDEFPREEEVSESELGLIEGEPLPPPGDGTEAGHDDEAGADQQRVDQYEPAGHIDPYVEPDPQPWFHSDKKSEH